MQAGLQLKNMLVSNNTESNIERQEMWMSLPPDARHHICMAVRLGAGWGHGVEVNVVACGGGKSFFFCYSFLLLTPSLV